LHIRKGKFIMKARSAKEHGACGTGREPTTSARICTEEITGNRAAMVEEITGNHHIRAWMHKPNRVGSSSTDQICAAEVLTKNELKIKPPIRLGRRLPLFPSGVQRG
jgi:hypothetical protein